MEMSSAHRTRCPFAGNAARAITLSLFGMLQSCSGGDKTVAPQKTATGIEIAAIPKQVGAATAAAVTKTIGASGGTITSGDAKLTVTIPAGAVSTNTTFSVQPITSPNGKTGAAYRLLPSRQFPVPVTLTFSYSDADVARTNPAGQGIGYQDATGVWRALVLSSTDTVAKTVIVQTTHFTDFVRTEFWRFSPTQAVVDINQKVQLQVVGCVATVEQPDRGDPPLAFADRPNDCTTLSLRARWTVSGPGRIDVSQSGLLGEMAASASYIAPATRPNPNTVTVTAKVDYIDNGTLKQQTFIGNITITGVTLHVVGTYSALLKPIAALVFADITDRVEFDLVFDGNTRGTENEQNFPSNWSNPIVPAAVCKYTLNGTFEYGTYLSWNLRPDGDYWYVSFSGQQTLPGMTWFPQDGLGCKISTSSPGSSAVTESYIRVIDPSNFYRIGITENWNGYDGLTLITNPWTFVATRTK